MHKSIKNVYILFFGGEPTLNWDVSISTAKCIMDICLKRDVSFKSGIVTNGYLLDSKKISDLIALKCNSIQITLDGPKYIHDSRRHLISGKGTFDIIIKNIHSVLDMKCVSAVDIRINVDSNNANYVNELLDYLEENFDSKDLNISIGVISGTVDSNNTELSANIIPKGQLSSKIIELLELVSKHGFAIQDFYSFDGICILKSRYSFALSPDGSIYRCLSMVGREELSVGNISNVNPFADLPGYYNKNMYNQCIEKNCEFLPLCHTGCKFDAIVEYGTTEINACKYDQYCDINRYLMSRLNNGEG